MSKYLPDPIRTEAINLPLSHILHSYFRVEKKKKLPNANRNAAQTHPHIHSCQLEQSGFKTTRNWRRTWQTVAAVAVDQERWRARSSALKRPFCPLHCLSSHPDGTGRTTSDCGGPPEPRRRASRPFPPSPLPRGASAASSAATNISKPPPAKRLGARGRKSFL